MKYVLMTVLLLGALAAYRHSFPAGAAVLVTVAAVIALKAWHKASIPENNIQFSQISSPYLFLWIIFLGLSL